MEKAFKNIDVKLIKDNTFKLIGTDWMLITAGTKSSFNTMTASWGGFGILWDKPVTFCFIRPQRYTYEFVEKNDFFTLTFFEEKYRDILELCGTKSGRDIDKIKATGLVPLETERGNIYFEQAQMVLECQKIYNDDIKPENFIISEIETRIYPARDYHRLYIAEIINALVSKE